MTCQVVFCLDLRQFKNRFVSQKRVLSYIFLALINAYEIRLTGQIMEWRIPHLWSKSIKRNFMKYVAIISKSLRRNNSFLRTEPSKLVNFSAWKYNEFMLLTSSVSSSFGLLSYSTMNSSIQTFHSSKIFVDSLKTTQ